MRVRGGTIIVLSTNLLMVPSNCCLGASNTSSTTGWSDQHLLSKHCLAVLVGLLSSFPRYREQPDNLSAAVSGEDHDAGLRPSRAHSLCNGLRHAFEDRLIAVETPQRLLVELLGHAHL